MEAEDGLMATAIGALQGALEDADRDGAVARVAGELGLSADHLRRRFTRAVGVSPQRFLQALAWRLAEERLRASAGVLQATLDAGLSGPGRLHDLALNLTAATPGEVARGGAGLQLGYGFAATPFGEALLGWSERGLMTLCFSEPDGRESVLADWRRDWPRAEVREDGAQAARWASRVFAHWRGEARGPLAIHVRGTAFQLQVWNALLRLPAGALVSYQAVATAVGRPRAVRAAAGAVGANPLSVLIPCHRVLRQSGAAGGYRWGLERKRQLLGAELARNLRVSP